MMQILGSRRFLFAAAVASWVCFASALAARAHRGYGPAQVTVQAQPGG